MKTAIALLSTALFMASTAWAASGIKPAPPPPPYAGVYQPQGIDEIGLWRESDEDERKLADSPVVIRDEALTAFVKSVLCKVVGDDRCSTARVYILREPSFNATMTANGTMRVFSGLLLRARSEAELGSVLGHEFGHFEKRHTLEKFKGKRSGTDLISWAAVLASASHDPDVHRSFLQLRHGVYGRIYRFGRDTEREADMMGIGYLNASALSPQAASRVWSNMIAEQEASALTRGLKKPRFDRVAFFASHPPEGERAAYLSALALPEGADRDEGAERYRQALAKWLPIFLDDQIKLNDFGASEYLIKKIAEHGWTASLWYARGELFRARGAPRDLVHATEFYANAIALEPEMAAAHRGLGLSMIKTGRENEGRAALQRYLGLNPDAADAAMIGMTIASAGGRQ